MAPIEICLFFPFEYLNLMLWGDRLGSLRSTKSAYSFRQNRDETVSQDYLQESLQTLTILN
jgi:hypothetical protein